VSEPLLVGVDAGTSVIKAVVFDPAGRQLAVASRPNRYDTTPGGGAVQDLHRTYADALAVLSDLSAMLPDLPARLAGVAVTGQGDGTWLIDAEGEPVGPGWLWLDARAGAIAEEIMAAPTYRRHYERTGTGINACQQSAQLLHMKRHTPEIVARAATAFHCKDWLYFKLTGVRAIDPSETVYTYGDFRTRAIDEDVVEALGLSGERRLLPPIVDGARTSHPLSPEAAAACGLRPGTPVVLAHLDVVCSALGAGCFDPSGSIGVSLFGSTGMAIRFAPTPADVALNAAGSGYTFLLPSPGAQMQAQSTMAATLNIDWVLDLARGALSASGVDRERAALFEGLDARILAAAPGVALYHPYISEAGERGPFLDPFARAGFIGLARDVGYSDLVRCVFEGLALASRDCFEAMGGAPAEVRVSGGAARSRALRLILASALGASVRTVEREEAGAAGAAMTAAVCLGFFPGMAACHAAWVEPTLGAALEPDPDLVRAYDDLYPIYRDARIALQPVWRRLASRARR
jgi:erythritol kinase